MKLAKILTATACVLGSPHALAFTPPYHINGTAIVGTATFKSSGGCKIAPKKFAGAQFGSIQDSTNATVGQGVISADGTALLAVSNLDYPQMYQKYYANSNPPQKGEVKILASFIDNNVLGYIVAESGCAPGGIWTAPTSYATQTVTGSGPGSVINLSLKQSFSGYLMASVGTTCDDTSNPGEVKCNGLKKFSGGMTFKGSYVTP